MQVRPWAFSFDGFGGHGHIWVEVWNRDVEKWQLVDIFNNYYFEKTRGQPLSALELRVALLESSSSVALMPIQPAARPGYVIPGKAMDYFRRGVPEWYMWMGNAVFTYHQASLVRALSDFPVGAQQLSGILQGVYPKLQILETPQSREAVSKFRRLRMHLFVAGWVAALGFIVWILAMVGHWRAWRMFSGSQ